MSERDISGWAYYWTVPNDYVLLCGRGPKDDLNSCTPFNVRTRAFSLIEDNELAYLIAKKMRAAGIQTLFRSELPPGKNPIEELLYEMNAQGKSIPEINIAIKALAKELGLR